MTKTPEEWLAYLTAKMDKERPRTDLLRSYTNGSSPLPEMGPNLAKAWLKFQRRDRKSTRLNSSHIQKSRMPSSA